MQAIASKRSLAAEPAGLGWAGGARTGRRTGAGHTQLKQGGAPPWAPAGRFVLAGACAFQRHLLIFLGARPAAAPSEGLRRSRRVLRLTWGVFDGQQQQ